MKLFPNIHRTKPEKVKIMRKLAITAVAVAAVAAMALTGCSSRGSDNAGSSGSAAAGFAANSVIGVALPAKTSENWVLAGDLFTTDLTNAGFQPDVQYAAATGTVADQQNQISSMVTKGAKVIIIGAADGGQLSAQVKAAHDAGATVIAYDRLILNSPNVDYYVAYDNEKVGELQGQALLDGMKAKYPDAKSYNIELFSGSPDDANSAVFFNGAMKVLQPKIDDGTLKVVSGQTAIAQTATQGWLAQNAQTRMDTLLAANYSGNTVINGVLSPNDTLARAIITSVKAAGKDLPIVTGQDSEVESVKSIMAGEQYSTINKDTRGLVEQAVKMVQELQQGKTVDTNDTTSYNNGVKVVPAFLLPPQLVTKANAAQSYANDPTLEPLTK
jgi:putative multiple sugar transport system substrate-binding protein